MDKAVVTDGRLRVAVTIIRSLGRMGVAAASAEARGARNLGSLSRFASSRLDLPAGSLLHPTVNDAETLIQASNGGVIVPVFTPFVALLSRHKDRFGERAKFLVPPHAALAEAHDKEACRTRAKKAGIPVPATRFPKEDGVDPKDSDSLRKWAADLPFPVIVKYRSGEDMGISAQDRFAICRDADEVARVYPLMDAKQSDPIAQEYIEGEDWGAAVLYDRDSGLAASFTYRSLRQKPMLAGPTVYAEAAAAPELIDYSCRLLSQMNWQGMAMLDFRRDKRGRFHLLEVNPRFWGSMALADIAGVDFARAYYRASLGHRMRPEKQRDGVRIRFFPQDFASIGAYAKISGNPARYAAKAAAELLNPFLRDGLFQAADPLPGLAYLVGGLHRRHARN